MGSIQFDPLLRQVGVRFAVISLVICLLSGLLIWSGWRVAESRSRAEQSTQLSRTLHNKLHSRIAQWTGTTDLLASAVNFQRLLSEPGGKRWALLRTYLNSMDDAFLFDDLIVVDSTGAQVFKFREDGYDLPVVSLNKKAGWVTDERRRRAFWVMKSPVWLGLKGGNGHILTYLSVENEELDELADEGMVMQLVDADGNLLASTVGHGKHDQRIVCRDGYVAGQALDDYGCAQLSVGEGVLRVVVAAHLPQVITPASFMTAGLLFLLAAAIAFYMVVGRWLGHVVRRVAALGKAVTRFDEARQVDSEVLYQLRPSMDELA